MTKSKCNIISSQLTVPDFYLLFWFNTFWQSDPSASHHWKFYNIFKTAVVDVQISHDVIVGVRKLIWHNLSPENLTIGQNNDKKRENLSTGCVSQKPIWKPSEHYVSTASQRAMGSVTAAINYLRKVCLQTAMPSTWIHFNAGNGHICLGTSNPLWVTLTYDRWREQTLRKIAVSGWCLGEWAIHLPSLSLAVLWLLAFSSVQDL